VRAVVDASFDLRNWLRLSASPGTCSAFSLRISITHFTLILKRQVWRTTIALTIVYMTFIVRPISSTVLQFKMCSPDA